MNKLSKLLQRPGIRYLLVGGSVYVLELIIIFTAQHAEASAVQAVALAYVIGTAVSFLLQKLFTFGDRRMHHSVLSFQVLATIGLVLFNFGFTILMTNLLTNSVPAVVVRTGCLLVTTLWNFYLYRTRIFKQAAGLVT